MSKTPRTDEHLRMKEENGHTVIVSSEFARQLETELADKDRQLAEAYDYAANLLMSIVKNHYSPVEGFGPFPKPNVLGVLTQIDNAYTGARDQLAEALADANHWKSECNALQRMAHEARAEIVRKDKLIEQMKNCHNCANHKGCLDHDFLCGQDGKMLRWRPLETAAEKVG